MKDETVQVAELASAEEQQNAVENAEKALNELKAQVAEAKRKLAEAKKAASKSRPVRMSTFLVLACNSKEEAVARVGEQVSKSDVHYCAEKTAIDLLAELVKDGTWNENYYAIVKHSKADTDGQNDVHVETLWVDKETNQIVIE